MNKQEIKSILNRSDAVSFTALLFPNQVSILHRTQVQKYLNLNWESKIIELSPINNGIIIEQLIILL